LYADDLVVIAENEEDLIKRLNEWKNKCVSMLARRIPHHTALSNAAAPNSECPPTVVAGAHT